MKVTDYYEDKDTINIVMDFKVDDLRNLVNELDQPVNETFAK